MENLTETNDSTVVDDVSTTDEKTTKSKAKKSGNTEKKEKTSGNEKGDTEKSLKNTKKRVPPVYRVAECANYAKQFGVSTEVVRIALRENGKCDDDYVTLLEARKLILQFRKKEVM